MRAWRVAMWLMGAGVLAAGAPARAASSVQQSGPERRRALEQDFIARAHYNNQQEIALGQLAAERAQTKSVRALGQAMVNRYQSLDAKLARIAERRGVPLAPPKVPQAYEQDQGRERLPGLSGKDFESHFLLTAHRDSLVIDANGLQDLRAAQLTAFQVELLKANDALRARADELLEMRTGLRGPQVPLSQENG